MEAVKSEALRDLLGLSPEEVVVLQQLTKHGPLVMEAALRAEQRRAMRTKVDGTHRTNEGWTIEDAKRFGLENSLLSTLRAHEKSVKRYTDAKKELDRTAADVEMVRAALHKFETELEPAVDIADLAPS